MTDQVGKIKRKGGLSWQVNAKNAGSMTGKSVRPITDRGPTIPPAADGLLTGREREHWYITSQQKEHKKVKGIPE